MHRAGSTRGGVAASAKGSGSSVGRSLSECTARSTRPAASASSISLVNMPLEPTWAKVTSCSRSPVVLMISISTSWPCTAQQRGNVVGLPQGQLRATAADAQLHRRVSTLGSVALAVSGLVWLGSAFGLAGRLAASRRISAVSRRDWPASQSASRRAESPSRAACLSACMGG